MTTATFGTASTPLHRLIPESLPEGGLPRRAVKTVLAGLSQLGDLTPAQTNSRSLADQPAAEAIKALQQRAELPVTGELDQPTLDRLRGEVSHQQHLATKTTVARVQSLLAKAGFAPEQQERTRKQYGESSQQAVRAFQQSAG